MGKDNLNLKISWGKKDHSWRNLCLSYYVELKALLYEKFWQVVDYFGG